MNRPRVSPSLPLAWLSLCSLYLCVSTAFAASPTLGSITPRGAQRGTEAVFFFNGARLADAQEVLLYYPGVTVTKLEVVNDTQVKVTVKIDPHCRLGEHAARLRTASGITELQTFSIGHLPLEQEKEPNNDFAAPQKIPLNVTVHGVVDNEDVDYYLVECKQGQRLTVEIEGMRLGTTLFDPYIAILDLKRFELAASDDTALGNQDGIASVLIPADGSYVIQVRDSAYGGNGSCMYRLHVGTFPRPLGTLPAGGKAGEEIEVTYLGDVAGPLKQKVKLPAAPDPHFGLFAQDAGGMAPSANKFRVVAFANVLEAEPNNALTQATRAAELPIAFNGVIEQPADVDFFRFAARKGQVFDVHCYARRLGSQLDPVMIVYNAQGGGLVGADDAIGPDSYFRFAVPEDGEYLLSIQDHLGKGGPAYFYRVEITPVQPRVTLSIPKVDIFGYSQERQTIAVPRGNRYACLVNFARGDFGGPLILGADNLPKGLTLHADTLPESVDTEPVVFEAAADAPLAGTLATLHARHADPNVKIPSFFDQSVILVGVGNVGIFWKHHVDRAAVAVTEEVPFKVSIVEPKVPLVQNGYMNLKVVAERKPDFKAPIAVYPLFVIPNVGAASGVTIPEGQTEVLLPINAAPNAPARKWKIAVLATADFGKGPVWVSSQLAELEIAPPFVTFAMERAAGEQGKTVELFCKVQHHRPFEGVAKVHLVGLPPKVTAPVMDLTKDMQELTFKVALDPASPPGTHGNIWCQVYVPLNGDTMLHNVGGTQVRIDVPLPPQANAPPPPAQPAEPAKPAEKRLSRLERLRLEQEQREKAAKKQ